MTKEDRTALEQLQWATQALAVDAHQQLALFPEFVDKPFELIDDFDNWFGATRWRASLSFSNEQMLALEAVQQALSNLGPDEFTKDAVTKSTAWAAVRLLARAVLDIFGWPLAAPPHDRGAYVPAG